MSDIVEQPVDIRAIPARIDRDIAENQKLRAESEKFNAEQRKLYREEIKVGAEQMKLAAAKAKLRHDHGLAPWLAIVGLVGGILSIANFASRFFIH